MTGEERQRIYELCGQILIEHDPAKLIKLVQELNDLLDTKPTGVTANRQFTDPPSSST
jgi:hypothetical protein